MKEPKDLGIRIASKAQAFWEDIERKLEVSIIEYEESLIGDRMHLELAKKRIAEEKEKFK